MVLLFADTTTFLDGNTTNTQKKVERSESKSSLFAVTVRTLFMVTLSGFGPDNTIKLKVFF